MTLIFWMSRPNWLPQLFAQDFSSYFLCCEGLKNSILSPGKPYVSREPLETARFKIFTILRQLGCWVCGRFSSLFASRSYRILIQIGPDQFRPNSSFSSLKGPNRFQLKNVGLNKASSAQQGKSSDTDRLMDFPFPESYVLLVVGLHFSSLWSMHSKFRYWNVSIKRRISSETDRTSTWCIQRTRKESTLTLVSA